MAIVQEVHVSFLRKVQAQAQSMTVAEFDALLDAPQYVALRTQSDSMIESVKDTVTETAFKGWLKITAQRMNVTLSDIETVSFLPTPAPAPTPAKGKGKGGKDKASTTAPAAQTTTANIVATLADGTPITLTAEMVAALQGKLAAAPTTTAPTVWPPKLADSDVVQNGNISYSVKGGSLVITCPLHECYGVNAGSSLAVLASAPGWTAIKCGEHTLQVSSFVAGISVPPVAQDDFDGGLSYCTVSHDKALWGLRNKRNSQKNTRK